MRQVTQATETTYSKGTEYIIERQTRNGWISIATLRDMTHAEALKRLSNYGHKFGFGNVRMR